MKLTAVILSFRGTYGNLPTYEVADYNTGFEVILKHRVEEALLTLVKEQRFKHEDSVWYFEGTYDNVRAEGEFRYIGRDLCDIIKEYEKYDDEALRKAIEG